MIYIYGPIVKSLLIVLANIEDSNIKLKKIQIENQLITLSVLSNQVVQEYKLNITGIILSLLGSLNIIGNPNNLLKDVKDGFKDLA
jgi:hypothetical protein